MILWHHQPRLSESTPGGSDAIIRTAYKNGWNTSRINSLRALFNRPKLVILDEPFNFLDPSSQNILKHELTEYNRQTGATILISSHNLQHTIDISTRITLLEKGHIINDMPNTDGSARAELENYFETK